MECCANPVPNEAKSFGSIKSLFRPVEHPGYGMTIADVSPHRPANTKS